MKPATAKPAVIFCAVCAALFVSVVSLANTADTGVNAGVVNLDTGRATNTNIGVLLVDVYGNTAEAYGGAQMFDDATSGTYSALVIKKGPLVVRFDGAYAAQYEPGASCEDAWEVVETIFDSVNGNSAGVDTEADDKIASIIWTVRTLRQDFGMSCGDALGFLARWADVFTAVRPALGGGE